MGHNQLRYVTAQGFMGTIGSGGAVIWDKKDERVVERLSGKEVSTPWALGSLGSVSSGC